MSGSVRANDNNTHQCISQCILDDNLVLLRIQYTTLKCQLFLDLLADYAGRVLSALPRVCQLGVLTER